jgi:hypothetical protein
MPDETPEQIAAREAAEAAGGGSQETPEQVAAREAAEGGSGGGDDAVAKARAEAEAARQAADEARQSATADQAALARERSEFADQKLAFAEQQAKKGDPGFPKEVVDKIRTEAAGYRTKLREAEGEVQRLRDAAKTDVERLTGEAKTLESRALTAEQRLLKLTIARKAGLDDELADRLVGETEAELEADAKALAKKFTSATGGLDQGSRGSGTRSGGGTGGGSKGGGGAPTDARAAMNNFIRSHGGQRELPGQSASTSA